MLSPREDLGAITLLKQAFKPQTMSDGTFVTGAIIDTSTLSPQSLVAIFNYAYTTASGASGAYQTVTLKVEHGAASNLSDAADFKVFTYQQNWTTDGANSGVVALPVDLRGDPTVNASNAPCKRYIRVSAKLTKSGTVTISAQTGSASAVLGGLLVAPASTYAAAGYNSDTVTP